MDKDVSRSFESCFIELKDPRVDRTKFYPLVEILFTVLCGSICGAESWRDFVDFGEERLDFLKKYYEFKNGIPSKNTFSRVFAALNPEMFKKCFIEWVKSLQELLNEVIAIDGKTLCGSADNLNGRSAIHMVSAFASGAKLILAQQVVDEKSNEITAIPKLLELLDLRGHTVTIDAMGTQKAIAKQIIDQGGDYILALKGNQGTLNEDVRLFLETELCKAHTTAIEDQHYDVDKGHGRIETRHCVVSSQIDWLSQKEEWAGLKTIIMVEETQEMKEKQSTERRFFISSLSPEAQRLSSAIRSHWSVESQVHWVLDVVFNEDQSTVRKDNAAENMALIRHITLNMLNNSKKQLKNVGVKALRKKAGWGDKTLRFILEQNF
jgi:predicted transposase YbfD/YdcC